MKKKTTLFIDDVLFKEAKRLAIEEDMTLQEMTNRALSSYIQTIKKKTFPPKSRPLLELKKMFRGVRFSEKDFEEAEHSLWSDRD